MHLIFAVFLESFNEEKADVPQTTSSEQGSPAEKLTRTFELPHMRQLYSEKRPREYSLVDSRSLCMLQVSRPDIQTFTTLMTNTI